MPWESPHIPSMHTTTISPDQQTVMPHRAQAISSPSDWQEQYAAEYQYRSAPKTTMLILPLVSPQSSHAYARYNAWHNRMNSWGIASSDAMSPQPTTSSSKGTMKVIVDAPPLQAVPPNLPLPPVPKSPRSQVCLMPALQRYLSMERATRRQKIRQSNATVSERCGLLDRRLLVLG